jgi:hypothetical protein
VSYKQFPATNKLKALDSAADQNIGSFQVAGDMWLRYMVLNVYVKGLTAAGAKMRVKVYGNSKKLTPIATSEWVTFTDISGYNGGDWLGWLRFDFAGQPLKSSFYHYMDVETANYTENGNTHYIGVLLDYAVSLSNTVSANDLGVHMAIAGEQS